MPAAFEVGYDDRVSGEKWEAETRCEAVRAALAADGIAARIEDDPPWMDAGNLSGYYQDCSGGTLYVTVADGDLERARALAAKALGAAPPGEVLPGEVLPGED